jgi:transcriptional repressor NrdR
VRCPFCNDVSTRVIDSRLTREGREIRRRRQCEECERRFTTRERVEELVPKLMKRDERREEFDRAKLEASIAKACVKRPVRESALQRLVDRVERRLVETGEAELPTSVVGDFVLRELIALDVVAASRFASVFRKFESAADYDAFFAGLAEAAEAARGETGAAEAEADPEERFEA